MVKNETKSPFAMVSPQKIPLDALTANGYLALDFPINFRMAKRSPLVAVAYLTTQEFEA